MTSATFGPVVAAGLVGALLVVVPAAVTATSGPGGDPPPPPAERGSPDDEPVLQPAGDDEVVILGTEEPVDQPADPGAVERDGTGDRSGPLESAGLDLVGAIGVALLGLLSLALAGISAARLRRMLHAWWSPAAPPEMDVDPWARPTGDVVLAHRRGPGGRGRVRAHAPAARGVRSSRRRDPGGCRPQRAPRPRAGGRSRLPTTAPHPRRRGPWLSPE